MKIAKNAETFVNFGVLGLSGGLGPQLVRAGSKLDPGRSPTGPGWVPTGPGWVLF